jgi:hypothetical protein
MKMSELVALGVVADRGKHFNCRSTIVSTHPCTCISTPSGWDETKCGYHNPASVKPFVKFKVWYMVGQTIMIKAEPFGKIAPAIVAVGGRASA